MIKLLCIPIHMDAVIYVLIIAMFSYTCMCVVICCVVVSFYDVKVSIVGSLRDREVACSASDRQGPNFESCVWRTVSSHHPQEVLLAQFSLYVHKGGLKPDSFHFIYLTKILARSQKLVSTVKI